MLLTFSTDCQDVKFASVTGDLLKGNYIMEVTVTKVGQTTKLQVDRHLVRRGQRHPAHPYKPAFLVSPEYVAVRLLHLDQR